MSISGSIQVKSVLAEPLLVATNDSYFSNLTGRTEDDVLYDKVVVPNNLWGTPRMCQHETHLSGATKAFSSLFGS